jgi:aarF domain-containing kinase
VRPNPKGKQYGAQVVLLDHGLYKQLSDPTRILFARLYKALVLNQRDEARKVCLEMGINNWKMFAMAILMRPLDPDDIFDPSVSRTQRLELLRNREKLVMYMQNNFSKRREEMMSMMQAMPIELLLVFRNKCVPVPVV